MSSGRETLHYSKSSKVQVAALLVAVVAIGAWTFNKWNQRIVLPEQVSREALWQIDSPTSPVATTFVRVQDTSFWAERSIGTITSSSYIATTTSGARLSKVSREKIDSSKIRFSPQSTVFVDSDRIKPMTGLIQAEGPLQIDLEDGSLQIPAGQTAIVLGSKSVGALLPEVGTVHDLQISKRVEFSWPALKNLPTNVRLEFARDSEFKTVLFSLPAKSGSPAIVDFSDRSPGAWFARLSGDSGTLAATSLQIVESKTPDQLRRLGRRWLSWRDRGEAALYRVDVSANETFQNVAHSFQVRQRQLDLTLVPRGVFFIRVTAIGLGGDESSSRPVSIEVQDKAEILRAATDLNDPDLKLLARGWKILLNDDEMSRLREGYVILRESELRGIRIADSVAQNLTKQVIFEVARDENFSNPERVKPDPRGELLPPALPLGVLYARLRRLDDDGQLGAAGPASRLTTLLPAPKPLKMITTRLKDASGGDLRGVELRWTLKAPVAGYELRLSTDANFAESGTRIMRTRQASRKIAAPGVGKFYWTVTAINQLGQPISLASKPQEVKVPELTRLKVIAKKSAPVDRAPAMIPPTRPELLGPADDAVIVGGARATTYGKLSWVFKTKKPGERFEVQIATDGDFVNVIEKKKLKSSEYTLKGDLPEGSLFWRVRKEASKEWSMSRRFELVYE